MEKPIDRLYKFLQDNHPGYDECMVCKCKEKDYEGNDKIEYLIIEKHECASGDLFLINTRLWYDYDFKWRDGDPNWEIIFKSK